MMFGKQIIAANNYYDYLSNYPHYSLHTISDDVLGYNDTFFELGNAKEKWLNYVISDIRNAMRTAFNERKTFVPKTITEKYDINSIGQLMVEKLNGV